MKITILPRTGIQQSEKYAVERIEKEFPRDWQGYASLEIVEKGRLGREIDLVILLLIKECPSRFRRSNVNGQIIFVEYNAILLKRSIN